MRERIEQLADGKFEYAEPEIILSTDKVEIEVFAGKGYTGDFVITSVNHIPIKGVVYTSDARMECLTPQFEGEEVRIQYQFHSDGLIEGDIRKGEFFIVLNQGEYNLSFVATVSRLYADTSVGRVRNLSEFARLARENFDEAYRLFYSTNFKNLMKESEWQKRVLYEGLHKGEPLGQKVDEFLAAIHKKKAFDLQTDQAEAEFWNVTETRQETLELRWEQWGYVDVRVSSDAAFLVPEKKRLKEGDFVDGVCSYVYELDETAMHEGKNYGRLIFDIPGKTISFSVCASRYEKKEEREPSNHRKIQDKRMELLSLYMDYRLKRIVTGIWANRSVELLKDLIILNPEQPLYELMEAQAFLLNRQRQEASWILERFKREWNRKDDPVWGYYLYLCTLMEREPSYVDRLADEIEELFLKNPQSPLLFWVLLFIREEYYQSSVARFRAIEQWKNRGAESPYLYLEAYYLIWQDSELLRKLGKFEMEVLNWACKQKALTKDIAIRIMELVPMEREFHPIIVRVLEVCYQLYTEDDMLSVLCGYLIKGQCFALKYHKWYVLGIEKEIRMTGLYEAYLMSLNGGVVMDVPKMLQIYAQYNSNVSWRQKAVLFVNILAGRERQPEVYRKYKKGIEQFAMEHLAAGNIDENLAVIYQEMIPAESLSQKMTAEMAGILFTHKLTCSMKNIVQVIVLEESRKQQQILSLSGGVAYFQVYTEDYCIILEDNCGNRFSDSVFYQDELLIKPEVYLDSCLAITKGEWQYLLYYFSRNPQETTLTSGVSVSVLLESEEINDRYKAELVLRLVLQNKGKKDEEREDISGLESYLSSTDLILPIPETRGAVIEFLAERKIWERAHQMVRVYGYDYLKGSTGAEICGYAIASGEFEEDEFLLGFAGAVFFQGNHNEPMMSCLCKYYQGSTKRMAEVWRVAREYKIDTFDLEERILSQMLYTTDYIESVDQIYDSYYRGGGDIQICLAYLSYFSDGYLRKDAVIPEQVFRQIQERYIGGIRLNDACQLALLKYFSEREKLTEEQYGIVEELLLNYIGKNMYFAFYKKFEAAISLKYNLYDKYVLEHHTNPGGRVFLYVCKDGLEYIKEELRETYPGIFVKEWILFRGEAVQYYITEDDGTEERVTESGCADCAEDIVSEDYGNYAKLNLILRQVEGKQKEQVREEMLYYHKMKCMTQEMFGLL